MQPYTVLEKRVGQTPLQAIEAWKAENPLYADIPASYAGRLDPMASGKLLVLLGNECRRQNRYRTLDKEYEIEVLLDIATDTGDTLGMPTYASKDTHPETKDVLRVLRAERGTKQVPYPRFSSKTVNGKPLFLYALEGTFNTIAIPVHEERIHTIKLLGREDTSVSALRERIGHSLIYVPRSLEPSKTLGADFRQDAIRDAWNILFEAIPERTFLILRLSVLCGTGTYMRSLAERIGESLGTSAFALSIRRTRIGRYMPMPGFWIREF